MLKDAEYEAEKINKDFLNQALSSYEEEHLKGKEVSELLRSGKRGHHL